MFYADVDLGGGTYAYKKKFLKMVENAHAYYMPDFGGMCDMPYKEVDADHHVYIRVIDVNILNRIVDVLNKRYRFIPLFNWRKPTDEVFDRQGKTYEQLNYCTKDYMGREVYPGLIEEEE